MPKKIKKVFITKIIEKEISIEDGGRAIIAHVQDEKDTAVSGMFLKLQSWDDDSEGHEDIKQFLGKKIKVTVEVIE
jgi:hypothetical protein